MESSTNNETYNRPNLDWICTAEPGCGCPNGPSPKGGCQNIAQCQPVRVDSSWKCNRPDNRGGACETGPDPNGNCCKESQGCVPRRSLRNKRKIFVICCVSWITGILLLGIWGPNRNEFFAPGDLTSSHAQIWSSGNAENRCIACHAAGETDPFAWFMDAFSGGTHIGKPQYEKCLTCHQKSLEKDHALLVHNIPKEKLDLLTANAKMGGSKTMLASAKIFSTPVNHNGELACAHCHQEHHGRSHDLAAMTNQQCQNCHASQFDSFADGHPEFKSYANTRRTRIAFDHYSHQAKHYAEAKKNFDCNSCHIADNQGNVIKIKPFESSCAECHGQKIDATLTQGMPIFRIPSIDVALLRDNGLEVGHWPDAASGSFDGGIPPVMKILLASDLRAKNAMDVLGPDFDLFDIDEENKTHLTAVYNLAISIKSLMYDLSQSGQASLIDRLNSVASNEISRSQLQKMVSNLSSDTFSQAQEKWFPELASEKDELARPLPGANPADSVNSRLISQVIPAAFNQEVQNNDDDLLAKNPLQDLLVPAKSTSANATQGSEPSLNFQDLPSTTTQRNPNQTTFDFDNQNVDPNRVRKNKFVEQTTPTPSNATRQDSAFQPNSPNSVGNKFFHPKTNSPQQDFAKAKGSDELVKNPLANAKPKIGMGSQGDGPKKVANPYTDSAKQNANKVENKWVDRQNTVPSPKTESNPNKIVQTEQKSKNAEGTEGPIVIRDDSVPSVNPEDLLAENPIAKLLKEASQPHKDPKDLLSNNQAKEQVEPAKDLVENQKKKTETLEPNKDLEPKKNDERIANGSNFKKNFSMDRLPPEKRVPLGGWYRDDESLTVAYRQTGHADPLTVNWYEFVSQLKNAKENSAFADLAHQMTKTTSPGLCVSCHSVDKENETHSINWYAEYRDITKRGFTKFSHRPHMIQSGNDTCSTCHQINPESNVMSNYTTVSSIDNCQSGFHPIRKESCTSCHNQNSRIQNCTQCHNYHVGSFIGNQ